jgi:hypothetical protein
MVHVLTPGGVGVGFRSCFSDEPYRNADFVVAQEIQLFQFPIIGNKVLAGCQKLQPAVLVS